MSDIVRKAFRLAANTAHSTLPDNQKTYERQRVIIQQRLAGGLGEVANILNKRMGVYGGTVDGVPGNVSFEAGDRGLNVFFKPSPHGENTKATVFTYILRPDEAEGEKVILDMYKSGLDGQKKSTVEFPSDDAGVALVLSVVINDIYEKLGYDNIWAFQGVFYDVPVQGMPETGLNLVANDLERDALPLPKPPGR